MYGEFDKDGIGWFIANDYLYAVNQETFKWKRYPLPAARFHGNSSRSIARTGYGYLLAGQNIYLILRLKSSDT
jgi:hypothetical protein